MEKIHKDFSYLKKRYPDCIILFRVGEFYEAYGEHDAIKCSELLGITLITWGENPIRTKVLFPHHALDIYLPKLVGAGERVVICNYYEKN